MPLGFRFGMAKAFRMAFGMVWRKAGNESLQGIYSSMELGEAG